MAVKKARKSDRLQVMERIDARMNPRRRRMEPTNWALKGELFMNCSCTVFCPCVVSLGKHPPTNGYCQTWFGVSIDSGHFEGEPLDGINAALLVDIPGKMAEGGWKVAVYIDESATQKAYNGLLKIFSGAAGGTTGVFHFLVSEILGAERERVIIEKDGGRRKITVGRKIQGEIELIGGKDTNHPVMVSNSKYWMGPDVLVAQGLRSKVRDYGRVWDFDGKSADITPIDWKGPKP
ncbi:MULTISPECIES: DUF1326 domain-containing protein [unclassified Dinoroseobacter]|uniref:DUF1326 domain-containing protein n=1 Tax=unclassified Dinoroseobacter TaxID=2620028 RepID=UPI003C7AF512